MALDAASGATIWNDQPLVVEGAPTLAGDRLVYPGVAGGGPGAIDVRDGAVLWNVEGIDFRVDGPVFVTSSGTFRPPLGTARVPLAAHYRSVVADHRMVATPRAPFR